MPDWPSTFECSPWRWVALPSLAQGQPSAPPRPSEWRRLMTLTRARMLYARREPALYAFVALQLLLLGVFVRTVFLRVERTVSRLDELGGALLFSVWVTLFAAASVTPVFVRDRVAFEQQYLNGAYGLAAYAASLLLGGVLFHLAIGAAFQLLLWFLMGLHDSFAAWVFAALSTAAQLSLLEGYCLLLVHCVGDGMLATSASMVSLGVLFLFSGYFVRVTDAAPAVAWLTCAMPTKYALDSLVEAATDGQTYTLVSGAPEEGSLTGAQVRSEVFHTTNISRWVDLLIVMLFGLAVRLAHYALLRMRYRHIAAS